MENMVEIKASFWKDKNVLLTGHTGFKGSWTALWLSELGAKVHGYSLPAPTTPSLYHEARVASVLAEEMIGDIGDYNRLLRFTQRVGPEIVIHMAAQPLVRLSYEQPIETYATNVMGTVHVLEAIRYVPAVRSAVIVTTDKCYENFERDQGYSEDEAMGGYDPYSSSKGCAELVVSAMRRSFFKKGPVGIATARAGNVIGGGDWAKDRIIPDLVTHFAQGQKPLIRNPSAIRPWQHVLEPIAGYLTLAEALYENPELFSEGWNFGPHEADAKTVRHIADYGSKAWGGTASWSYDQNSHPHEAKYLKLNINKALEKLRWKPRLDVDSALLYTFDWYREYYANPARALNLTLDQISKYQSLKS